MKGAGIASRARPRHLAGRRPHARPAWPRRLRAWMPPGRPAALAALGLGAGLAVGGWIGASVPRAASTGTATTLPPAVAPSAPSVGPATPPACQAAVQNADEVISYLIGGIHDRRLEGALQRYVATAHTCRKESP